MILSRYLDERGRLLPRYNGVVYDWMHEGTRTDARASPIVAMVNGKECSIREATKVGDWVAIERSVLPVDGPTETRRHVDAGDIIGAPAKSEFAQEDW